MAPEQVETPGAVDHRADIYSLGVVFYELLTGELPLGKFAPPSQKTPLDARLDHVVLRSLEKEPGKRYQQAREVKTEIQSISTNPAPATVADWVDETEALTSEFGRYRRLTLVLWASALLLVPLLCVLTVVLWSKWQVSPAPSTPSQPAQVNIAAQLAEEVHTTSVEVWFSRMDREAELGYDPFTSLNALITKAKDSVQVRDKIIQQATATIDDPSQNMFKRWQCCYVLSGIGDARGIPAISRALKDQNCIVRGVAACALGDFDEAEAKAALEQAAAQEQEPKVQAESQKALRGEYRKPRN